MADNNLARNRNDVPEFFADGDPLAELARIVGYEDRVAANPQPVASAPVAAPRHEPIFNLEDELLREFERYDAPRLDPADDLVAVEPEPVAPRPLPGNEAFTLPGVVFDAPVERSVEPEPQEEFAAFNPQDDEPSVDAEWPLEEYASEPAAVEPASAPAVESGYDASPASWMPADLPPVDEPVAADFAVSHDAVSYDAGDLAPAASPAVSLAEPEKPAGDFDLAAELETSFAAAPAAVQPLQDMKRKPAFTPSFRMPLANFQSGAGVVSQYSVQPKAEPKAEAQAVAPAVEPVIPSIPAFTPVAEAIVPSVPAVDLPLAGPAEPVRVADTAPVAAPAKSVEDRFMELDALFSDVDRYSVTNPVPAPAPVSVPAAAVVAPAVAVQAPKPAAPEMVEDIDPFADVDFELALDDLELDLADMVVAENSKGVAPNVSVASAPVQAQAQPIAPAPVAPVAYAAPAYVAPATPVVAAAPAEREQTGEPADLDDDVPFDPALIADSEEQPEVIAELDVPVLTVEEKPEPVYRNDFDLDIDAELASLLEAPENVASQSRVAAEAKPQPVAEQAANQPKSVYADLDDFERALEEDFRRSLATPLAADDHYAPADEAQQNIDIDEGRGSSRRWIAPLAAVGVLAICGAGAYAWFGSSSSGLGGNGEPVVIAADSEPVKVAPANPGGKTVPNQDKAVYDRVAGAASDTPKQQQLISSSEEPVDVVQKTLMPENIPLDSEDDAQVADGGEAEDPRLLPQDQQQAVTVMPRKVKTMIVRADGTLVEQEVDAPAAGTVASAVTNTDRPAQGAPAQSAAAFPTAAPAAQQAGVVPVSAPAGDLAGAASNMPASAQAPAAIEQLADTAPAASVRAPVPTARPSQQPTNVVASVSDQGNVRAPAAAPTAAAAPAAANTQVASVGAAGYVIQIASLPSQADAQKSYQNLSNKFGSVIGGRGVDIKAAEVAGKGTFYRVRIPAGSKDQAVALCEKYRAAGGSCLVAR